MISRITGLALVSLTVASASVTAQEVPSSLSSYDFTDKDVGTLALPQELREISGLASTDDGRVFTHDDEIAIIYQIDYSTGKIVKRFMVGKTTLRGDFEDIAIVKDRFFLMSSSGALYTFREGKDREHVEYTVYETGLTKRNNIEGVCYDPESHSLLLSCKDHPGKGYGGSRTVYTFSLKTLQLDPMPRFVLSLKDLRKKYGLDDFAPSAIARNPRTRTFYILSSHWSIRMPAVVEVSSLGAVLGCALLPGSIHKQPEGIVFLPDGSVLISDEGVRKGKLTRYPLKH